MRLIHCRTLQLQEFLGTQTPSYAILSHTWQDDEITFADFSRGAPTGTEAVTSRWVKITQTCKLAIAQGYEYVWIDTCCIDKSSSSELTEAINSMYSWYADSGKCFAYLSDFNPWTPEYPGSKGQFFASRWFSRGWTLQELIAPKDLEFYDFSWTLYGSKASLYADIAHATGIDENVLRTGSRDLLAEIPVCQKMSWAASRETRRPEDIAYSLLGIFGVHMPLIYGEGANAFLRLQKKIIKSTNDLTILAWKTPPKPISDVWKYSDYYSVLAPSPEYFAESGDIVSNEDLIYNPDFSITNKGIRITVALPAIYIPRAFLSLHCHHRSRPQEPLGIYLQFVGGNVYNRVLIDQISFETVGKYFPEISIFLGTQSLRQDSIRSLTLGRGYDFYFEFSINPTMSELLSSLRSVHPKKRWGGNFVFYAYDAPSFLGFQTYQTIWEHKYAQFVIACGFGPDREPWICVEAEKSDLWHAITRRDYARAEELSRKLLEDEAILENNTILSVKLEPYDYNPRLIHVRVHTGRAKTLSSV
ncbi:heterokaryon incompatibility protein-domain-containing protein [Xylaria digitata]|nr:heterokaryon incompatibility protein-domain-containing protein [Xylaria digitata]